MRRKKERNLKLLIKLSRQNMTYSINPRQINIGDQLYQYFALIQGSQL